MLILDLSDAFKPTRVFDWHKCAKLIKENQPKTVMISSIGVTFMWLLTDIVVYENGEIADKPDYFHVMNSDGYIPSVALDNDGYIECWIPIEDNVEGWDGDTYWPQSALDILNG